MGFAVRNSMPPSAPRPGDVVPVHSSRRRADRVARASCGGRCCSRSSRRFATCRGPRRGGWPIASAFRRFASTTATARRPTSSATTTIAVVVCRGTEPNDWNDIRADLDLATVMAETVGRVHRGFKREVDDLWPRLEQALVNNTRPRLVHRPFAGRRDGDDLRRAAASSRTSSRIRGRCTRSAARASATAAT